MLSGALFGDASPLVSLLPFTVYHRQPFSILLILLPPPPTHQDNGCSRMQHTSISIFQREVFCSLLSCHDSHNRRSAQECTIALSPFAAPFRGLLLGPCARLCPVRLIGPRVVCRVGGPGELWRSVAATHSKVCQFFCQLAAFRLC